MAEAMHMHPDLIPGVVACILWAFIGLMGFTASPAPATAGRPVRGRVLRFRVCTVHAEQQWAQDVAGLVDLMRQQPVGDAVEIFDLVRNRVDTVSIAADGSVWEFYGSRHVFTLEERYSDADTQEVA